MKNSTFLLFFIIVSCNNAVQQESPKCPIQHFGLSWEEAAYETLGRFEGDLTPCEKGHEEKEILFAITKKGIGEIMLYGKHTTLKSLPPIVDKGTVFWEQSFFNDSLDVKINLQNKKFAAEEKQYMSRYTYQSTMTLSIKDTLFNYDLIGVCDTISVNKLVKK